jgi:tetratricopeptide (TPR) repeat protein
LLQAIDYFNQALKIDPNNSAAHDRPCRLLQHARRLRRLEPKDGFPKAKEAALKALEMDEASAEAHTSLAFINFRWTGTGLRPNVSSRRRSS